jgi:hypothetical protein
VNSTFTVSQIARWRYVPGRTNEIDHMSQCPSCKGHNRVRLGAGLVEMEKVVCRHFMSYEYRKAEHVVYVVFGLG